MLLAVSAPPLQRWRRCAGRVARAYQCPQLRQGRADDLALIGEYDVRGDAWLIDRHDDVSMRGQFLHLERIHLPKGGGPFREDQNRIARLAVGHARGRNRIGLDVLEPTEEERGLPWMRAKAAITASASCMYGAWVGDAPASAGYQTCTISSRRVFGSTVKMSAREASTQW